MKTLELLFGAESLFVEYVSGVGAVLWGIWLMLPVSVEAGNMNDVMLLFAPRALWGSVLVVIGACLLASLRYASLRGRRSSLFALALFWFAVCASGILRISDTDPATYFMLFLYQVGALLRLSR